MADQTLKINVGSSYDGSGMSKAMGAVNTLSQKAGKAASSVGRLGSSFGMLGGEAGKAVGAVASFAGAFAAGGVWGLAIAGVTATIQLFKDSFNMMDVMNKKAEEQAKAWQEAEKAAKAWLGALKENEFNTIISNADKAVSSLNKLASAQARVALAQDKLNQSQGAFNIAQMEANGASHVDIATARAGISAQHEQANVEAKKAALENAKAVEMQTKVSLEAAWITSGIKGDETKLREAVAAREAAEKDLAAAEVQQQAAALKAEQEIKKAEKEDAALREADINATWESVSAAKERADQERDYIRTEKELKDSIDKDKKLQDELNAATEELKNAQNEYASALRNAQVATGNLGGMSNGQISAAQGLRGGKVWDKMTSSNDWGTSREFDQHKADNYFRAHPNEAAAIGYTPSLNTNNQNRLNYLAGKKASGQELSKSQEAELKDLLARDPETIAQKAEKAADDAAEKVKAAMERKQQAEEQMRQNVSDIKTMMQKLGLK